MDFEAEEGECVEPKAVEQSNGDADDKGAEKGMLVKLYHTFLNFEARFRLVYDNSQFRLVNGLAIRK